MSSSKDKIKVAHIITRLDRGGSAENTLLTVKYLNRDRYEPTLIYGETVEGLEEKIRETEKSGVKLIYVKELVRHIHPRRDFVAFWKLYQILRREKYDMVHTHSSKGGALGRLAAFLTGAKVVHTPHGHVFYGYFGPFASRCIIWIERALGMKTDRLITLTSRGREEHAALKILPAERIVSIHSGIHLEEFRDYPPLSATHPTLEKIPEGPRVAVLARLVPIKGHRYLLEAVPKVIREVPQARFLLIGDGPLRGSLEKQCRSLGVGSSVFFLGHQEKILSLISGIDLLVLPSLNEGMGRVLLEAQAMGKPVIGTRVGGIPDVIREGETGFVVPPKDPPALAEAILSLLKDPEKRRRMGEAARKWVDGKFSVEEMVRKIEKLYEEIC